MTNSPKATSQRPESAAGANAVLSPDQIADLWERGYTVIPRTLLGRDPYAVADAIQRPGMAQQWGDKPKVAEYRALGWRVINCEAWPGLFAPYGAVGDVEIDGLVLMHQPQHRIDAANRANHDKAHQNVDDWYARQTKAGFSVETRTITGHDEPVTRTEGDQSVFKRDVDGAPTIDTTVGIPHDLMSHVKDVLEERDALCQEAVDGQHDDIVAAYDRALKENPHAPKWPTLRAIAMPKAIERIRAKLKAQEGTDNGEADAGDTSDTAGIIGDGDRGGGAGGSAAGDASGGGGERAGELGAGSEPGGGTGGDGSAPGPSSGDGAARAGEPPDEPRSEP